jgi:hypothetical protein
MENGNNGFINFIAGVAASWFIACLMCMLIALCFEFQFTWRIGTGVWLCTCLLNMSINKK